MDSLPAFRHTLIVIVVYQYSVLRDVVQLGPNISLDLILVGGKISLLLPCALLARGRKDF